MLPSPTPGKQARQTYPQARGKGGKPMSVAKVIELTAASPKSIEDAVEAGVKRADQTLDQVEGVWVQEIKAVVKNGKVAEWRVNMKVTFLLKD
jgi:flavin-binding protein dodecin